MLPVTSATTATTTSDTKKKIPAAAAVASPRSPARNGKTETATATATTVKVVSSALLCSAAFGVRSRHQTRPPTHPTPFDPRHNDMTVRRTRTTTADDLLVRRTEVVQSKSSEKCAQENLPTRGEWNQPQTLQAKTDSRYYCREGGGLRIRFFERGKAAKEEHEEVSNRLWVVLQDNGNSTVHKRRGLRIRLQVRTQGVAGKTPNLVDDRPRPERPPTAPDPVGIFAFSR